MEGMYYNINYEIASIVMLLILVVSRWRYFSSENKVIKLFMSVILFLIATCSVNIIAALAYDQIIPSTDVSMHIIETIYLSMAIFCCYMQLMVINQRYDESAEYIRIGNFVVAFVSVVLLLFNISFHFLFEYVDHEFVGHKLFSLVYIVYALMFLEMGLLIFFNRKRVRRRTFLLTIAIMVLPLVCLGIQAYDDRLLVSELGATFAFLIYSYSLEDQDYEKYQNKLAELEESRINEEKNRRTLLGLEKVKSVFLSNLSGELDEPVMQIMEISSHLKENTKSDEVAEYAARINEAGVALSRFAGEIENAAREDVNE